MATPKRQTKKKEKSRTPVYFLSLTVENVRCFGERQTLDLSDGKGRPAQWTIILGDNGVGKTTLLQALASIVPIEDPFSSQTQNKKMVSPRYAIDAFFFSTWKPLRSIEDFLFVSADFSSGATLTGGQIGEKVAPISIEKPQGLSGFIFETARHEMLGNMVCLGYGAVRRMAETTVSEKGIENLTESLFSDEIALINAEEWLLQADYSAHVPSSIQAYAEKQRDKVKKILIELLPDVTEIKFSPPSEEKMLPMVFFKTPYAWVPLKSLSLGYKTLIAWMVDFARRMFELYRDESKPLEQPAVVLVDEIDLHLHPKMQRELMSRLSKIFPNTQFIATAHSPLVVQSATDANIVLLRREGDHIVIDNNPQTIKGWRVDQILTSELFGLESARPLEYDTVLAERRKILAKTRLTKKDKERLRELQAKVEALPAMETMQDVEAMDIIRRAADILKKETATSNNDSHK